MKKVLLAGLVQRETAAVEILVGMTWPGVSCFSLPRCLTLSVPHQSRAARSCSFCVIDVAGFGMRHHSTDAQKRLIEFIAGRPALLILRGAHGRRWARLCRAPETTGLDYIRAPYTPAELRRSLGMLLDAPVPEPSSPLARRPLTRGSSQPSDSMKNLYRLFPTLVNHPPFRLVNQLRKLSGDSLVQLDQDAALLIDHKMGWLACSCPLDRLIEMQKNPGRGQITTLRLSREQMKAAFRDNIQSRRDKTVLPLDQALWELAGGALEHVDLDAGSDLTLRLETMPNLTRLARVRAIDIQLAAVCIRAPQNLRTLLEAFAGKRNDVLRFTALSLASGLAEAAPAPAARHRLTTSQTPAQRRQAGFFRSLLDKLMS